MQRFSGKILAAAALLAAQVLTIGNAAADAVNFVLREYNGKIALFCENEDEPIAVYKTPIDNFFPRTRSFCKTGLRSVRARSLFGLLRTWN